MCARGFGAWKLECQAIRNEELRKKTVNFAAMKNALDERRLAGNLHSALSKAKAASRLKGFSLATCFIARYSPASSTACPRLDRLAGTLGGKAEMGKS